MDVIKHTLISMEAVTLGLRSQDLGDFNVQSMIIKQLGCTRVARRGRRQY